MLLFFLMIRRPPRSTLWPYTTSSDLIGEERVPDLWAAIAMGYLPWVVVSVAVLWGLVR